MAELARAAGLTVRPFQFPAHLRDIVAIVQTIHGLYQLFRAERPDVVMYYMLPISLWARIAAWLARVPVRTYKPPSLWDLGLTHYRLIEYATAWMDTVIIASSRALQRFYMRSPLTRNRTVLSYYGLPIQCFDPHIDGAPMRRALGISADAPTVVMIANMVPPIKRFHANLGIKGHETLLRAAAKVVRRDPRVRFLIVGDEPAGMASTGLYAARLRAMAHDLGLDSSVIFAGHRSDIPAILAVADTVVVPSLSENLGGAVEPLLMEKPVVASNVGGLPEVVIPGETGLLVPPGDSECLAEALLQMLALPVRRRRQMGQRGRQVVMQILDIEQTVVAEEQLLYQILRRQRNV